MHIWNCGHNCFQELKKGYSNTVDSYSLNLKFISTCFSCSVFMDVKGLNVFYKKKNDNLVAVTHKTINHGVLFVSFLIVHKNISDTKRFLCSKPKAIIRVQM